PNSAEPACAAPPPNSADAPHPLPPAPSSVGDLGRRFGTESAPDVDGHEEGGGRRRGRGGLAAVPGRRPIGAGGRAGAWGGRAGPGDRRRRRRPRNSVTPPAHTGPMTTKPTSRTTQLALLPAAGIPAQLQLDERTRRVGLAGVAQARAILAESRR